ncbi:MAG: peroxiredoxin [Pseudomonadota bacterium]
MLKEGDKAPDFDLPDQQGDMQSLQSLLNNGPVVVYFYPIDFSPVCTAQACAFRDNYDDVLQLGKQVVGISPQTQSSHQRFAQLHALPFPLLSDTSKRTIRAYGVDGPFGMGVRRATFLVDESQHVVKRVVSELLVGPHLALTK